MSARIEPGCMAVIRRPFGIRALLGMPVTVARRVEVGQFGTVWLCDAGHPEFPRVIAECCLRRIDDGGLASEPERQPERIDAPEGIAHA